MASLRESFIEEWRGHRTLVQASAAYSVLSLIYIFWAGTPPLELKGILGLVAVNLLVTYGFMGTLYGFFFFKNVLKQWRKGVVKSAFSTASDATNAAAMEFVSGRGFWRGLIGLVTLQSINFAMAFKSLIHFVNPYKWDPALAVLDKRLFFGVHPQSVVVPFVEKLHAATAMTVFYNCWFLVLIVFCGYAIFFDKNLRRRLTYLWTFLLVWIVGGSILATVFSSVGPAFYHEFYPHLPDVYRGMLGNTMSSSTVFKMVVEWSRGAQHICPNGLSAFPSMHICIAALVCIYASRLNKYLCAAVCIFGIGVFAATIYTGLHYMVDGYAGIALAAVCWYVAARWLVPRDLGARTT